MPERLKVGDRVGWKSEAGHVSGMIILVHTHDFDYKATHRATPESPQYQIFEVIRRIGSLGQSGHCGLVWPSRVSATGAGRLSPDPQPVTENPICTLTLDLVWAGKFAKHSLRQHSGALRAASPGEGIARDVRSGAREGFPPNLRL